MKLCILGSTGSIGTQALESAENLGIKIGALAAGSRVKLLEEQCRRFKPERAYIGEKHYNELKTALADTAVKVVTGEDTLNSFGAETECDTVLNALTGIRGLRPTVACLKADKTLALANKETLVAGGSVVIPLAKRGILPVDSEHSAIFQCLQGRPFLRQEQGVFGNGYPRRCVKASQLVHGQQGDHRQRHHDEQGLGAY